MLNWQEWQSQHATADSWQRGLLYEVVGLYRGLLHLTCSPFVGLETQSSGICPSLSQHIVGKFHCEHLLVAACCCLRPLALLSFYFKSQGQKGQV